MALIEGLRTAFGVGATEPETTEEERYRCIDCYAEFEEQKQLCPKCGGEEFKHA